MQLEERLDPTKFRPSVFQETVPLEFPGREHTMPKTYTMYCGTNQTPKEIIEFTPTIDSYLPGTTVLYNGKTFGLLTEQPFQFGYDMPETGTQIHFHGPNLDHLTYGRIKDYQGNVLAEIKDSYDLAVADFNANNLGLKRFF